MSPLRLPEPRFDHGIVLLGLAVAGALAVLFFTRSARTVVAFFSLCFAFGGAVVDRVRAGLLPFEPVKIPPAGWRQKLVGRVRRVTPEVVRVRAHTTGEPCIAASLELGTRRGLVFLRSARSVEFLLEQRDGTRVLVRGEAWVRGTRRPRSRLTPDLVAELGLDATLEDLPALVEEQVLREGDRVEVRGELAFEAAARRAGSYRDAGLVRVLRGRPALVKVLEQA